MQADQSATRARIREFRLCKFDGDRVPGDGKRPVEILVGGDGRRTDTVRPGDAAYEALCAKEGV